MVLSDCSPALRTYPSHKCSLFPRTGLDCSSKRVHCSCVKEKYGWVYSYISTTPFCFSTLLSSSHRNNERELLLPPSLPPSLPSSLPPFLPLSLPLSLPPSPSHPLFPFPSLPPSLPLVPRDVDKHTMLIFVNPETI